MKKPWHERMEVARSGLRAPDQPLNYCVPELYRSFVAYMYTCVSCLQLCTKTTTATLFFLEVLFKFSFLPRSLFFSRSTIVCLSSPYFRLWSVDVHEQHFRLFPLVFCKWYFYKQIHFQNINRGIVLLYPYIQTRLQQAGSEHSVIKTKHHEKD